MKMTKRGLVLLSAACAILWLAGNSVLQAQRPNGILSEPAYREMRRLAQRLDERAQHAGDQAQHQESWFYRRDRGLLRSVNDFARRAHRFDEHMANYRAAPWQVDDELRRLLRSAQDVQSNVRRSRYADDHTVADWNEVVDVLNRMIQLYDSDVRGSGRSEYGAPQERREYREGYGEGRPPGGHGYPQDRLARLSRELVDHASRSDQLAEGLATGRGWRQREFFDSIRHFDQQARELHRRVESGQADPQSVRDEARHLLEDARRADSDMRQSNVFPEVWDEWRGAMQVLERILNLVGA